MTPTDVFVLEEWTGSLGELIWKYVLESLKKDDTLGEELIDWLTSVEPFYENDSLTLTLRTNSLLLREVLKRRLFTRIQISCSHIDPKIVVVIADDLNQ